MSKVRVWREMVEYLAANRKLLLPVLFLFAIFQHCRFGDRRGL